MNIAMKYVLFPALLLLSFSMRPANLCSDANWTAEKISLNVSKAEAGRGDIPEIQFLELARKHKIPTRKFSGIKGVASGYYLVAGVFGQKTNAIKFRNKLRTHDLLPEILNNPANHLNYVYLRHMSNGLEAIRACVSQMGGSYSDKLWILQIENNQTSVSAKIKEGTQKSPSTRGFKEAAREMGVPHRIERSTAESQSGYYLIAGVYGDKTNARKQMSGLRNISKSANLMELGHNRLQYVYLQRYDHWKDALNAHKNAFQGLYNKKLWVLALEAENPVKTKVVHEIASTEKPVQKELEAFFSLLDQHKISARSEPALKGLRPGYYVISGVFGDPDNALSYAKKLRRKFPAAGSMKHPSSGMNYTYLARFESGLQAAQASISHMDGQYKGKTWILHLEELNQSSEKDAGTAETEKKITSNTPTIRFAVKEKFRKSINGNNDKLLEKADSYFEKMWYAEAAQLYEMILEENPENQSFEIIRKAGDSHYFNTNMERAHYWYEMLYSKYKSDMRAENLFKYAHSLKGIGKYGRAKRLMKLYSKASEEEASRRPYRPRPREAALDNVLDLKEEMEIRNIAVNSEYSDFSPMFFGEDKLVFSSAMDSAFFNTRRYKWNNQPYLDLYVAKINQESDEVRDAVKFSKKINTKYHEAAVAFSPDQKTIYFTRNNYGKKLRRDNKGVNHLKIYMSRKVGDSWSEAEELPFNSDNYSTGHPALSPDGKQLYFVSDMPGSMGKTDIFVVDVVGPGQFSDPRNLGPDINTEGREMFPFISDRKLYFSSDGHEGLGGLDVYEAVIGEEGFEEVLNLGQPVNSRLDDFSYIINESTQKGFFASNRRGGKGDDDIYSFKRLLPEEPNENAIAGVVTEMVTGEVMPRTMVELLDENNIKLMEVETAEDGSFVFEELESNTRYVIRTQKENYFENLQEVSTVDNERVEVEVNLKRLEELIVIEDGLKKLKIDNIYFDFDKFNIRTDAAEELDKLVEVMNTYPTMVIAIESHTDSRGKRAYNKYLSDKRAKSTRDYLISKGIDPKRIQSATGYGEERLLNECNGSVRCSSAKHQLNRRSEFIIVNM